MHHDWRLSTAMRARRILTFASLGAAIAGITIVACRDDSVTSPSRTAVSPQPPQRQIVSLGNTTIGVQSTNTSNAGPLPFGDVSSGATGIHSTGIQIPAGAYFRIRVSGHITVGKNDAVLNQVCPPPPTHVYPAVGSYGPLGTGNIGQELQVIVQTVDSAGHVSGLSFPGQGGTNGPDSVATPLQFTAIPLTISVGHAGLGSVCSNNGQSAGYYTMSGTQTVVVEQVTPLLKLAADPPMVRKGHRVTFTASSPEGYSVTLNGWPWVWHVDPNQTGHNPSCPSVNPCTDSTSAAGSMAFDGFVAGFHQTGSVHVSVYSVFNVDVDNQAVHYGDTATWTAKYDAVPGPAARWVWKPKDTTTSLPADSSSACAGGTSVCKKKMLRSGTMWAFTSTTPGVGDSDSKFVAVTNMPITVSCGSDSVTRGQTATCSATGPTALTVTKWLFIAGADTIVGPTSGGSWQGPVVTSGTVTTFGDFDGDPGRSGSGSLNVRARPRLTIGIDTGKASSSELILCFPPNLIDGLYGLTNWPTQCGARLPMYPDPDDPTMPLGATLSQVPAGGPNAGFWYVAQLQSKIWQRAQVHADLSDAPAKHVLSGAGTSGIECGIPQNMSDSMTIAAVDSGCFSSSGLTDMRRFVRRHESCHMILAALSPDTLPNTFRLDTLETVVRKDSSSTDDKVRDLLGWINGDTQFRSKSIDVRGPDFSIWLPQSSTDTLWDFRTLPTNGVLEPRC